MIDYTKISDNPEVIRLVKAIELLEERVREIDNMALVRRELELLNEPPLQCDRQFNHR